MGYSIKFKKSVEKEIRKLPKEMVGRIIAAIEALEEEPRPKQSIKLRDTERTYRLRVGDYRVIYQIDDEQKEITVFHIRHRKDVYRYV